MPTQHDMLATCRDQFAMYAQSHRAKVSRWQADIEMFQEQGNDEAVINLQTSIADTIRKAEENERLCREVQAVMDQEADIPDVLGRTAEFGEIAYADGISTKNQQTQLGVHFEEVAEMLEQIDGCSILDAELIGDAERAMKALGHHFKNSDLGIYRIKDRLLFLDAVCDQLVTVTLSAVLHDMDPVGGLHEVNQSNFSKLVDGVMQKAPVTAKWVKGPDYTPPNLTPFI